MRHREQLAWFILLLIVAHWLGTWSDDAVKIAENVICIGTAATFLGFLVANARRRKAVPRAQ